MTIYHPISSLARMLRPLFLSILIYAGPVCRADVGNGYNTLRGKASAELLGMASSYIEVDTLLDKAVEALSIVANRYYENPKDSAARKDAITAMSQLGNIYSFRLLDYTKAYINLSTARMLAEEDGDDYSLAMILARLANIYNICYDEPEKNSTYKVLSEAIDRAISGNNEEVLARLAINMSILHILDDDWGRNIDDIRKIKGYKFPVKSSYGTICVNIIDAMDAYFSGDYSSAEMLLKRTLNNLPILPFSRFEYGIMYLLQYVYERSGNYEEEEKILRARLDMSQKLGLEDYEVYTYAHIANFFDRRNEPDSVKKYTYLYLLTKEELEQKSGLSKVKNVEMLRRIEKVNDEVRELSGRSMKERRHLTVAIAVVAVVTVLLLTFVYLFFNHKRNNRLLLQKNRELLDREAQLRLLVSRNARLSAIPEEEDDAKESDAMDAGEESKLLFLRILEVMEDNRAIYSLGFGLDDLAAILHMPRRNVSQAINACSRDNFHTFLNGYRIREACRIMSQTDMSSTTVEYIAESVGFKSRTSFASLFKKNTGLTPSEFWKMASKKS